MAEILHWKLSEFFTRFAPRFVLGTTYTASPVFFETSILPKIKRERLEGAVLLCDLKGFQMAAQEVGALRAASTFYSLVYPKLAGAFHPKVWIMADDEQVAVLCGSGNLTQSGFIENVEMFDAFEVTRGGNDKELCGEVIEFVEGLLAMWTTADQQLRPGLKAIASLIRVLRSLYESNGPGSARSLWFLSSFRGGFAQQLNEVIKCRDLRVAAPYFGGGLTGVKNLVESLEAETFEVFPAKQGNGVDLEPKDLEKWQGKTLRQLELQSSKSGSGPFAHLKLYGIVDRDGGCHSMTGSVNGTIAALEGKNVEAAILRKIDKPTFDKLFASHIPGKPPERESPDYSSDAIPWVGIHAVIKGPRLILSVDPGYQATLPLDQVSITWICGAKRESSSIGKLFDGRTMESLGDDRFPPWLLADGNASALEINGINKSGEPFRSFALVESFADLTATPLQRNAVAAMRALLSGDETPETAGINAIWQLFDRTLTATGVDDELGHGSGPSQATKDRPIRVPIWPPEAAEERTGRQSSHEGGDLAWFQKILYSLLREERKEGATAPNEMDEGDTEDGESGRKEQPKSPKPPKPGDQLTGKVRAWITAKGHYDELEERLWSAVVYARPDFKGRRAPQYEMPRKERLIPVASATFLVALMLHPGRDVIIKDQPIIERSELIASFLRLMLDDRRQGENVAIPRDHPYRYETFPPILQDIQMDPELEMDRDFVTLFVALFALFRTDATNGNRFPLLEWLKFRHFVGSALVLDEPTRVEVLAHARRYLLRGEGAPHEEALRLSLDAMDQMSWEQFTGFQYLNLIRSTSKNEIALEHLTPEIQNWADFRRRLDRKSKGGSEIVVNRFRPMCAQSGCNNANIRLPGMHQIGNLIPCICPACGTALIPDLLNEVTNRHGH